VRSYAERASPSSEPNANGGAPSSPGDPAATADAGAGPQSASVCNFGEPNDTRDEAFAIDFAKAYTGCLTPTDKDFYTFTAPNDGAGGYVVAELANVGANGWIQGGFYTHLGPQFRCDCTHSPVSWTGAPRRPGLGAGAGVAFLTLPDWLTSTSFSPRRQLHLPIDLV
jgi:hypothetical protein